MSDDKLILVSEEGYGSIIELSHRCSEDNDLLHRLDGDTLGHTLAHMVGRLDQKSSEDIIQQYFNRSDPACIIGFLQSLQQNTEIVQKMLNGIVEYHLDDIVRSVQNDDESIRLLHNLSYMDKKRMIVTMLRVGNPADIYISFNRVYGKDYDDEWLYDNFSADQCAILLGKNV